MWTSDLTGVEKLSALSLECGLSLNRDELSALATRLSLASSFADVSDGSVLAELGAIWRNAFVIALKQHWEPSSVPDERYAKNAWIAWADLTGDTRMGLTRALPTPQNAADQVARSVPVRDEVDGGQQARWLFNGKLHREDGPAYHFQSATLQLQEYYLHGALHRADGPAIESESDEMGSVRFFYQDGKLHRDDGPAIEIWNSYLVETAYWRDGQRHRPSNEGPAWVLRAEEKIIIEYWEDGQPHRDPEQGPAVLNCEGGRTTHEYLVRGVIHRDSRQGPALISHCWGAANIQYREGGELHRSYLEGPALIEVGHNGWRVESYFSHGVLGRPAEAGPARISVESDGSSGEEYCLAGELHRPHEAGPAVRWVWADGGYSEAYWQRGKEHRPASEGPAYESRDADGRLRSRSYYEDGELHRDPSDGPAYIWAGDLETGSPPGGRSFHWRGQELQCPLEGLMLEAVHG